MASMRPVSNRGRDSQLDLCAGALLAPNLQLSADPSGPLAHSRKAIMSRAPFVQHGGIHPDAVIPHPDAKLTWIVSDFGFDPLRPRVVEGVAQRFARNPVDFVAYYRMQVL